MHLDADRIDAAERAADTAVRIDPEHPRNFMVLAAVHLARRRWHDALAAADRGLALRSTHAPLLNLRAQALLGLHLLQASSQEVTPLARASG